MDIVSLIFKKTFDISIKTIIIHFYHKHFFS